MDKFEKRIFLILIFTSGIIFVGVIVCSIILMGIFYELESISYYICKISVNTLCIF